MVVGRRPAVPWPHRPWSHRLRLPRPWPNGGAVRWPARRALSVPERLGLFSLALVPAGAVYPVLAGATGLSLPCPLRTLTGLPCPVCGLTTAVVALVHGELAIAVRANPVVLLLAVFCAVMVPVTVTRTVTGRRPPPGWSPATQRPMYALLAVLAVASWGYQLHRLDWW